MKDPVRIRVASERSGIAEETIKTWAKRGKIASAVRTEGKKAYRYICYVELIGYSQGHTNNDSYPSLVAGWEEAQRTGFYKGRRFSPKTIKTNEQNLNLFFRLLNLTPSVALVDPDNLTLALSRLEPTERSCRYSQKDNIRKALISFAKYLAHKGLKPATIVPAIQAVQIQRVMPAKRPVLYEDQLKTVLEVNESISGRTTYDRTLMTALIMIAARAGLRRGEVLRLTLADVDMANGSIHIRQAKWGKARTVGICPELADALADYLATRPAGEDVFFLQRTGQPMTETAIQTRMNRLNQALRRRLEKQGKPVFSINYHGLRRTCATWLIVDQGFSITEVKDILGQSDIKTTDIYAIPNQRRTVDKMRAISEQDKPASMPVEKQEVPQMDPALMAALL